MKAKVVATKNASVKVENLEIKISQWLEQATQELQKRVFAPAKLQVPKKLRINVGSMTGRGDRNHTLGCCYRSDVAHGVNMITLNISTTDAKNSSRVLDVLAHELIHAIDDNKHGHKAEFKKMATAIGLTGQMTATIATPELKKTLDCIVKKIGKFPTQAVSLAGLPKDVCRMINLVCEGTDKQSCDHSLRLNKQRLYEIVNNSCLCCGGEYKVKLPKKYGEHILSIEAFKALADGNTNSPFWALLGLLENDLDPA